jgi:hypothetical protein
VCVTVIVLTAQDELKGTVRQLHDAVPIYASMWTTRTAHSICCPCTYRVSQTSFYLYSKVHDGDYFHLYLVFGSAIFGNNVVTLSTFLPAEVSLLFV